MAKRTLIVGGVAGGASAATRLRRLDEHMEIIMFERGEYISYANCGLPYYISGVIAERDKLLVQTPEGMKERFNIDVRIQSEVTRIFPETKEVEVRDAHGTYRESYDQLILSPGAAPISPPIPGISEVKVFVVRNVPDIDRLKAFIDLMKPQSAAVVGGGFIGLEMAENLHAKGVKTTIIEMSNQVMAPLDFEMAALIHQHLRAKNVELILNDGVKSFAPLDNPAPLNTKPLNTKPLNYQALVQENHKPTLITLQSGKTLTCDLVVLAIGVRPEITLAKEAGLEIGELGGIRVNERLQTSDPNIYAIGDAIEVKHFVTGGYSLIPLAGPANRQGRLVADIICGQERTYDGTLGTSIAKVFDLAVAATGANEKLLKRLNIPYQVSYTHPISSAGYYPGARKLTIKLIFSPQGKVLGAQIVGIHGVDKRIDDIAGVIRRGGTVYDLQDLELAYAPPFSSAKDPVNMAGYVAANIIEGKVEVIHWHEVAGLDRDKVVLIDVRTPEEHAKGNIPGSLVIPLDGLRKHLDELPRDKEIILYCRVGLRGYLAYRILVQHGFTKLKNLSGGWETYQPAITG